MNPTPELESTRTPQNVSCVPFPASASRLHAVLIVALCVFAGSFTQTQAAPSSSDYSILHDAFLAGGGRSGSIDSLVDISIGDFGGFIQSADTALSVSLGNVGQFNRPPITSGLADTTANGGSSPVLNFTVSDPESAPTGVQLSASSSDPVLIPVGGIVLGGTGTDRTIQVLPARGRTGSAVITLRVTDKEGLETTITFNVGVTIPAPKLIPEITWSDPAGIGFGTVLGAAQLNATANVPGTFAYTPEAATKLNAGAASLSVTFTPSDSENYQTVTKTVTLIIAKAPLTIRAENKFKREGDPMPALTVVYSGFVNPDTAAVLDVPVTLSTTANATSLLGNYPITVSGASDANYAITHVNGNLTITTRLLPTITWPNPTAITYGTALTAAQLNATADVAGSFSYSPSLGTVLSAGQGRSLSATFLPNDTLNFEPITVTAGLDVLKAPLRIRAEDKSKVYGAAMPALTAIYSGFVNGDTAASLDTAVSFTTTATASSNAGTYQITSGGASDANYSITFEPGTLTVTKAALTIHADSKSKVYGAGLPEFTATYNGFVNQDTTASLDSAVSLITSATASSNVGSYPITASGAADANYTISFEPGTLTVSKAPLTIRAEDKSKIYGAAFPTLTASYSGFVNQDTAASLASPVSLTTTASSSSNTGTYPITANGAGAANYTVSFESGILTVAKAPLTIRAEDKTKVYGAALPSLTVIYSGFVNGDSTAILDSPVTLSTTATAASNAGTYPISSAGASTVNYAITFEPGTLTVTKALLTIRAEDKTKVYGAALPALTATYSGFVNQDTAASLDTSVSLISTATASSNVGAYSITPSGASDANYTITFEPGNLSVSKAALTIRAENKFKRLGDALPLMTASYTGFVNQDNAANLDVPVALNTTAIVSSPVGSYPITASGAVDANYDITHISGTLTVTTKLVPGITWANPAPIVYGTALGATQLNATADVAGTFSYNPQLGTVLASSQGTLLAATFTPSDSSSYETLTVVVGIDVLKAPLIVRAEDMSKVYGAALPTLTATYSGFVIADTASSLDDPVSLTTTATASSAVGTFPITASGASDGNYSITFQPGTMTVTKAALVIRAEDKSKMYGASVPTLTASYSGFVNQDTADSLDTPATLSTAATTSSNVGSFPITVSGASDVNYSVAFESGALTVSKAPLTIRAEDKSKFYGATVPLLTASYTGFVNQDDASSLDMAVTLSTSAAAASNVGSFPIIASGAAGANYTIIFSPGTLTVAKAQLTIRAEDKTKVYGTTVPALTVSYSGFVNQDSAANLDNAPSLSTTAAASSSAGSYPISVGGASDANYSITFTPGTLTITKAPLTIRADNKSKVYGSPMPTFSAAYVGFVGQDTAASLDSPVSFITSATVSSPAGAYAITPSGASGANYLISFESGTLSVSKAALTIRADDKFIRQGQSPPFLTATYIGFVNQDTAENLDAPVTLSTTGNSSSAVGSYPIIANGASDANYTIAHVNGKLTVTAKIVPRVTWSNPTPIVYGSALGVAQLDATTDVSGSFSYDPPLGTVLSAGQGRVLAATFTPSDSATYETVVVPSSLDVLKAPLTITAENKSRAYGATLPVLTAVYSGFVAGDSAANLASPVRLSTSAVATSGVGSYPITADGASDANYAITFQPGTLTVTQATLTVTPKSITRRLGDPNPSLTGIIRGLKNADPISAVYVTTATTESPLGTYPITTTLVDSNQKLSNYSVTIDNASLTVQEETTFTGVAQDGYVAGALVFFDANKNGVLNANEPSTHTDSRGSFDLVVRVEQFDTNGNGALDPSEGTIVLSGGVDISTGIALKTALTAPPGSTVVSPLTTLLAATIESNPSLTVAESKAKLNQALGLPPSVEVTTFDPIVAAASNDGRAKDVLSAGAKVQDTLVQISTLVTSGDTSKSQAASAVIRSMASSVTAGTSINLDQPSVVNDLIQQSATRLGQTVSTQIKEGASQIIAGANQVKTDIAASTGNALEAARQLSQTQVTGQNVVTAVLEQVASGDVSINQAVSQTGKTAVAQAAQSAQAGDVLGTDERPGTFNFSQSAYQTPANGSKAEIVLNRSEGNFGAVTVVISLKNSSGLVVANESVVFSIRELTKTVNLLPRISATSQLLQQEIVPLALSLASGAPAESALGNLAGATLTVRTGPQIVQQPTGIDVLRGSRATVSISATGTPAPTYQWQRNGVNLSGQNGSSLTLNTVSDSDSGTYRVVVSNSSGTVTSAVADVRVISAPIIVRQPGGQDLIRGGSMTMAVVATGTPAPNYQWRRNGINLVGKTDASLALNSVTEAEVGRYDVVVSNFLGTVISEPADVFLVSVPSINASLASQNLTVGGTLRLEIQASGIGLRYEWDRDGVPISTATQPVFIRTNAQESDSGTYRVKVSNAAGTVTSGDAIIRIYRPIVFQFQPEGQTVQAGSPFKLSVQATGTGPLSYQWLKNGSAIPGAKANELAFNPVQLSDAGTYSVNVTGPFATVGSLSARLVVYAPPSITRNPLSQTVFVGDNVKISIDASGSLPLTYQWYKEGIRLSWSQGPELAFKSVQVADAGQYWAQISNAYGTATSVQVDLKVIGVAAPSITAQPQSQTVLPGADVAFEVTATGSAPLKYQWSKDGAPIIEATASRLELKSVQPTNAGEYTVVVSNDAGGVLSAAAILKVERTRGDFDGDGFPDLVFEDDGGFLGLWSMQGIQMVWAQFLRPPTTGDSKWRVAGSGDWNGDGAEDLLFQHEDGTLAVWLMKGTQLETLKLLEPSNPGDSRWRVVGTGDMNGDGQRDIVFQHEDGALAVWFMKGTKIQNAQYLEPANPGDNQWRVAAVGDIDGDHKEDLLFQHRDGTLGVWLMDGTKLLSASLLNPDSPGSGSWRLVGAADWNHDGKSDLLFQNRADLSLAVWLMNGTQLTEGHILSPSSPGGTWKVVAPK